MTESHDSEAFRTGKLEDQATALKVEHMQHADTKAALSSQAAAAARLSEDLRDRYEGTKSARPCIISPSCYMRVLRNVQRSRQVYVIVIESAGML